MFSANNLPRIRFISRRKMDQTPDFAVFLTVRRDFFIFVRGVRTVRQVSVSEPLCFANVPSGFPTSAGLSSHFMDLQLSRMKESDLAAALHLWGQTEGVGLNESDTLDRLRLPRSEPRPQFDRPRWRTTGWSGPLRPRRSAWLSASPGRLARLSRSRPGPAVGGNVPCFIGNDGDSQMQYIPLC